MRISAFGTAMLSPAKSQFVTCPNRAACELDGKGTAHAAQSVVSSIVFHVTLPEHGIPGPHPAGWMTVQPPRPLSKSSKNTVPCARRDAERAAPISTVDTRRVMFMIVRPSVGVGTRADRARVPGAH